MSHACILQSCSEMHSLRYLTLTILCVCLCQLIRRGTKSMVTASVHLEGVNSYSVQVLTFVIDKTLRRSQNGVST